MMASAASVAVESRTGTQGEADKTRGIAAKFAKDAVAQRMPEAQLNELMEVPPRNAVEAGPKDTGKQDSRKSNQGLRHQRDMANIGEQGRGQKIDQKAQ